MKISRMKRKEQKTGDLRYKCHPKLTLELIGEHSSTAPDGRSCKGGRAQLRSAEGKLTIDEGG